MASLYPTVTDAEFSNDSARLQQAILQSPANEIISFLAMPSLLTKLPRCVPSITTSSTARPSGWSRMTRRPAPDSTRSVSFVQPRNEATSRSRPFTLWRANSPERPVLVPTVVPAQ